MEKEKANHTNSNAFVLDQRLIVSSLKPISMVKNNIMLPFQPIVKKEIYPEEENNKFKYKTQNHLIKN